MPVMSALDHFPEDFGPRRARLRRRLRPGRTPCLCAMLSTLDDRFRHPRRAPRQAMVTLTIDGRAVACRRHLDHARGRWRWARPGAEALRHRLAGGLRLLPPVPGRDRGPPRHAGLLHHAGRARHGSRPRPTRLAKLRRGVMELYISDHPLDCLTCAANGDCELQDMAGAVGLRDVRYGYDGDNHSHGTAKGRGRVNPYFTFDPSKCIVCSRCVRACEEVQGTFALTIDRPRLRLSRSPPAWTRASSLRVRLLRRLRAGLPDRDADREVGDRASASRARVVTTCAYCGVGCSFKAEMQGERGPHGALQGRQGQRRPLLRQGPLRLGLCHPQGPHHQADDPRAHHRSLARSVAGTRRSATPPSEFRRIQAKYGRDAIGGITSSRCTNEETFLVQKLIRAAFGNNNVDTCARVCHSPTGYGLKTRPSAPRPARRISSRSRGRRHPGDRRQPDRRRIRCSPRA
jgi:formate dehydrogenase major subunit